MGGGACLLAVAFGLLVAGYYQEDEQLAELKLAAIADKQPRDDIEVDARLAKLERRISLLTTTANLVFLQSAAGARDATLPVSSTAFWADARAELLREGTLNTNVVYTLARDPEADLQLGGYRRAFICGIASCGDQVAGAHAKPDTEEPLGSTL